VLDHVISRAMAKDPVDRWTSMHDVVHQLRWIAANPAVGSIGPAPVANPWRGRGWWIAAATVLAAALAISVAMSLGRPASEPTSFHFEVPPPPGTTFLSTGFATIYMAPVLSRDGSQMIVPAIGDDGVRRLWLRRLNAAAPTLLPRTEGAFLPFWSPDDRSIGFFSEGKLMRLDLPGSPPQPLCDAPTGFGGTWGKNGVIVFAPAADMPLHRVADVGRYQAG
jgi:eukaryotic-like serine/threonine-protein kinase